jgi:hypothetical protein
MIYVVVGQYHDYEGTFSTNFFASTKKEVAEAKAAELSKELLEGLLEGKLANQHEFEVEEVESD